MDKSDKLFLVPIAQVRSRIVIPDLLRPRIKYMHAFVKNEEETFPGEELYGMHEIRDRNQGCYDAESIVSRRWGM
jgi:hypothetical protein